MEGSPPPSMVQGAHSKPPLKILAMGEEEEEENEKEEEEIVRREEYEPFLLYKSRSATANSLCIYAS